MKKIGLVDYYLDEFHGNHFPGWVANSRYAKDFEIACAYGEIDKQGGLTTDEWCAKMGIKKSDSLEALVNECDCIAVLAPDEAHSHERLSELAIKSKKPVFIDKVLADDIESGRRICETAAKCGSPMYSSSALRFFKELENIPEDKRSGQDIDVLALVGAASFEVYIVHQIEMMVTLCGPRVQRIMNVGTKAAPVLVADLGDATVTMTVMGKIPFAASIGYSDGSACYLPECTEFFPRSIDAMLEFFVSGKAPATFEDSLCVVAAHTAAHAARHTPFSWIKVEV
ncbi:MAG: Gfo/Idh/MocA family oxidoreductase [Oscillospiraceae bacterium]